MSVSDALAARRKGKVRELRLKSPPDSIEADQFVRRTDPIHGSVRSLPPGVLVLSGGYASRSIDSGPLNDGALAPTRLYPQDAGPNSFRLPSGVNVRQDNVPAGEFPWGKIEPGPIPHARLPNNIDGQLLMPESFGGGKMIKDSVAWDRLKRATIPGFALQKNVQKGFETVGERFRGVRDRFAKHDETLGTHAKRLGKHSKLITDHEGRIVKHHKRLLALEAKAHKHA